MVTILPALRQAREDLVRFLDRSTVEKLCKQVGHRWRDRHLDPYTTLHLFILQVLNQNTAMTHLPHLSGERFTPAAYCQARRRLPLALFERLVEQFAGALDDVDDGRWKSHRVWMKDGSTFSMPDTPELQAHFGQPGGQKPGCGFPMAHFLALINAHSGFLRHMIVAPLRTHDMAHAVQLNAQLQPGDIIVGDRGFCSYAHLALCLQANLHAVFRIHQKQIVDFHPHRPCSQSKRDKGMPNSRYIQHLGHCDQIVEWRKPAQRPKWMTAEQFAQLPDTILVRELKWRIRYSNHRVDEVILVTTLLDPERYPAHEIAGLYRQRWQVEVDLRDLKITLRLGLLKGHSVDVVKKEMWVFALVYNLVRVVMLQAAQRQRVQPHRLSFIDALRYLQPPKPARSLPELVVNPERPNRVEPRVIKRRKKQYPYMTKPRAELRKRLKKHRDAA